MEFRNSSSMSSSAGVVVSELSPSGAGARQTASATYLTYLLLGPGRVGSLHTRQQGQLN